MRRFGFLVLLVVILTAALSGMAFAKEFLSIATGGTTGTYYPLGGGIADIINRNVPELQVTSETGNASAANLNLIGTNQIEIAFAQNDLAYWAWKGEMMFKEPFQNIRGIGCLYPEHIHFITLKKNPVKDIMDLKGKRVSVGAPGSGVEGDVRAMFDVAGLKYDDMKVDFLDFANTTQRFKDDQLDAGFVVAGFPTSSVMDLATTTPIDLVSFSEDYIKALREKYPFFKKDVIPAGTYSGVDHDTVTPAVVAMLVCREDLSEDLVYTFTKTLWENVRDLDAVHAKAKLITLETALDGLSVPLHPGAAKYYKEKGIAIPEIK
ncbi:TAXI family TRAP transporter solute-binding subunit [Aminiphilus circumscriptus]|jgi:TRAP transporter TAXI family solute receptor|uniref:TAXI family TRAP transporter solute-binding subunit n=1 Tax=Aminiphilus circumscriptus TaxID=290732 RepID=UPI000492488A|nr:TAXI family TRAP transporter solute-binding subunit [Aminiphilus circumscriptus]